MKNVKAKTVVGSFSSFMYKAILSGVSLGSCQGNLIQIIFSASHYHTNAYTLERILQSEIANPKTV